MPSVTLEKDRPGRQRDIGPFYSSSFDAFYDENGKKAGIYTREDVYAGQWSFTAR
jgi:hypothetical protein